MTQLSNITRAAVLAAIASLTACGGGGGSSSAPSAGTGDSTGSSTTNISGKVIDGYVKNALVCLDLNANSLCDADEPSTRTVAGGSYTLQYDGSIAGLQVIAEVGLGAEDEQLGPITTPYTMLAPAESAKAVTPLSTLVAAEMTSAKVSAADAEASLKATLNLKIDKLLDYDFKDAGDDDTLKIAQVAAAALASVHQTLKNDDSVKGSGMSAGEIVRASIREVKDTIMPSVIGPKGESLVDTGGVTRQADLLTRVASQPVVSELSGRVQNIVASTRNGEGTVTSMAEVFARGLMIASLETGDYVDAQGNRVGQDWNSYQNALTLEYIRYAKGGSGNTPSTWQKVLVDGGWFNRYQDGGDVVFDGTSWIQAQNGVTDIEPVLNGNCALLPVRAGSPVGETVCTVAKDVSGKKLRDISPALCGTKDGGAPSCDGDTVAPAGSSVFDFTVGVTQDMYRLWVSDTWSGYPTGGTDTLAGFIAELGKYPMWLNANCTNPIMLVPDSYNPATGRGKVRWGTNTQGCTNDAQAQWSEATGFETVVVGGKALMKLQVSNLYRATRPDDRKPFMIFGFHQGRAQKGVYQGEFQPAKFKRAFAFNGDLTAGPQFLTRPLVDTVLKAKNLPAYPYPN